MPASSKVLVIAEAGVNHNGDLGRARDMVAAAASAGADIVKFQAFDPDDLVAAGTATAGYQKANTGVADQAEMLRGLALTPAAFETLAADCSKHGIEFLCTAFATEQIARFKALGMRRIKVASGELTNVVALRHFAGFGLPILLSTGMATLDEIERAIAVLREAGAGEITLLQCTSLYPAPDDTVNLRAIPAMASRFGLPVGFSDHTSGDYAAIAAVALGAVCIEKHFTLDRDLPGPDHVASLDPAELESLIAKLKATAVALGDGVKKPQSAELETAKLVRRSWHAARALAEGAEIQADDITLKRPADGLAPDASPVGRKLKRSLECDAPVHAEDLV